ncbi:MAG: hypothetical protein Q4F17_09305 [Eubacteriales bacterium]|nr:hypothetical protein [Eubacteriales bacterium]
MQDSKPESKKQNLNPLDEKTTYRIGNRSFVVEPVFKKEGPDTLGSVLLRLMNEESEQI